MIWQLAGARHARKSDTSRRIVLTSLLLWFTVDPIASVATGVVLKVVANAGFPALFPVPILALHRQGTEPD